MQQAGIEQAAIDELSVPGTVQEISRLLPVFVSPMTTIEKLK